MSDGRARRPRLGRRPRSQRARAGPSTPAPGEIRCVPVAPVLFGTDVGTPVRGPDCRATIGPHTWSFQTRAHARPDAGAAVKIQEAAAKSLLAAQGLPVPPWAVARNAADARAAAERFLAAGP